MSKFNLQISNHVKFAEFLPVLTEYVKIIKAMNYLRTNCLIDLYNTADARRAYLHERILEIAETTRDDKEFNLQLSLFCDEMLSL